ncbi:hypothetical protein DICPUDRAFT_148815 [Dictyostelium purpureum]|uniref:Uncharacterized protein n=1 Tax=Dictyostelium purpureum TaxID=5786 RepID=F0ZC30_DICPU|nr:uncharacterized protein DICPUDRAFT_148815 [Dictyostelium purpureum]EGC38502.1 hypothetical protein DICPUDRAFT_148815 [Dictyostelium purpureum]|eukprot:XP_003284967.1 hypothetical protein DICPUDRAFT_148815 [Dictyostelium purpureum]
MEENNNNKIYGTYDPRTILPPPPPPPVNAYYNPYYECNNFVEEPLPPPPQERLDTGMVYRNDNLVMGGYNDYMNSESDEIYLINHNNIENNNHWLSSTNTTNNAPYYYYPQQQYIYGEQLSKGTVEDEKNNFKIQQQQNFQNQFYNDVPPQDFVNQVAARIKEMDVENNVESDHQEDPADATMSMLILLLGVFFFVPLFFSVLYLKSKDKYARRFAWTSFILAFLFLFIIILSTFGFLNVSDIEFI